MVNTKSYIFSICTYFLFVFLFLYFNYLRLPFFFEKKNWKIFTLQIKRRLSELDSIVVYLYSFCTAVQIQLFTYHLRTFHARYRDWSRHKCILICPFQHYPQEDEKKAFEMWQCSATITFGFVYNSLSVLLLLLLGECSSQPNLQTPVK